VQEGRKLSRPSRRPAQAGRAYVSDTPDAAQERLTVLATPRDWFRYAVSRFRAAGLVFGHGATNAVDEAAFLILEALDLPIDALDPFADARLLEHERRKLDALIEARVVTRKPAAYLLNRIYIQGVPFYVDERVIVPRSFIGELLFSGLVGEGGLIETPEAVGACSTSARAAALSPFWPRGFSRAPAWTPSISRPTRSRWRAETSRSMISPGA
jgi:hypothetical protein